MLEKIKLIERFNEDNLLDAESIMQKSHKHHYVPEWYQKRFMLDGQSAYYRLDLSPEHIETPSGKVIKKAEVLQKGPGKFFFEIDLYTT